MLVHRNRRRNAVRLEVNAEGEKINTHILSQKIIIMALTEAYVLGKKRPPQCLKEVLTAYREIAHSSNFGLN